MIRFCICPNFFQKLGYTIYSSTHETQMQTSLNFSSCTLPFLYIELDIISTTRTMAAEIQPT